MLKFDVNVVRGLFPVLRQKPYPILLNNGATTPPLKPVSDAVKKMELYYGALGRGGGPQHVNAERLYEYCRKEILDILGADPGYWAADFTYNSTYALNLLIHGVGLKAGDIAIHTVYGHNSTHNPLHNTKARVIDIDLEEGGTRLDMKEMMEQIAAAGKDLKLVVVPHASNLTGHILPIHEIAQATHKANPDAYVLVDAAQTIAHIPVSTGGPDDLSRIDMLVACGHKAYAPYGSAFYIAPRHFFENAQPLVWGGGTVAFVSCVTGIDLRSDEARLRAGTPNLIGAVAFVKAMQELNRLGLKEGLIAQHELDLKSHFYGLTEEKPFPFPGKGIELLDMRDERRFLDTLGTILLLGGGAEDGERLAWGWVESRVGASCANLLALRLSGFNTKHEIKLLREKVIGYRPCDFSGIFLLRLSPAMFNTRDEIAAAFDMLQAVYTDEKYISNRTIIPYDFAFPPSFSGMLSDLELSPRPLRERLTEVLKEALDVNMLNMNMSDKFECSRFRCQRIFELLGIELSKEDEDKLEEYLNAPLPGRENSFSIGKNGTISHDYHHRQALFLFELLVRENIYAANGKIGLENIFDHLKKLAEIFQDPKHTIHGRTPSLLQIKSMVAALMDFLEGMGLSER